MRRGLGGWGTAFAVAGWVVSFSACSSDGSSGEGTGGTSGKDGGAGTGGIHVGGGGTGGNINIEGGLGGSGGQFVGDPKTCEEAAQAKTYIGCDFWPTVTANNVWSIFDYAVVVANAGDAPATVAIERNGAQVATGTVQPNSLEKFFLPWVPELKGTDADECGSAVILSSTVRAPGGAYHLTSSVPVTVYQFNALEYRGQGGPAGKDWSSCPGTAKACKPPLGINQPIGCFSFSNDASLLLPTTALTGNYRLTVHRSWETANMGAYFAVTGTADGTNVSLQLSANATITAGGGVQSAGPGQVVQFPIARGEVVEVVGTPTSDLAGTLIQSTAPVQVISGIPCIYIPDGKQACDHLEESVFPAETLGKRYFVVSPTGPNGNAPGHEVRLVGNVDGTTLQYPSGAPAGAPPSINAGQVVDLGIVLQPFEVTSPDHEFAVVMFQQGASVVDPSSQPQKGDPSQSNATSVEQYRTKYVFLAPDDYDVSYVDIIMPDGTAIVLDGSPLSASPQAIGSGYSVARAQLGPGVGGAHVLTSDKAVGIQVVGYGAYTSYQYPGGLNLTLIAPPPPPIK